MDSTLYKQLPFIIKRNDTANIRVECNITQDSKVEFCTTMTKYAGNAFFGGADNSSSTDVFLLDGSHFIVGKNFVKINTELNKKYTFILKGKGYTEINGKVIHEDTFDWNFSKKYLIIAGAYRTGSFISYHQYFYYCKIYEDGTNLSYHLVPCKRLSDNIVGLYDLVNDKFYTPSRGAYKESFNLNSVTSIQIPEGNVIKIEDKEGKILWANINKLAYGIRWNSVNQATTACERIGNLELHKTLPIQSRFKVCIHKGKEIQYYCNPDDSRFRENPTILSKDDFVFENCDGLPSGIVSCDENSEVTYKIINDIFADYKYLYAYIYIRSGENTSLARIVYVDIINKTAYVNAHGLSKSTYADITAPLNLIVSTDADYTVELGTVLNGYDGEIGVDTGGKFYQWSVDNEGNGNEVWISEYKCVSYAKEVKRHIIGCSRACILNTAFNDTKWGWIGSLQVNTVVNVINYNQNLRGGSNDNTWDEYLGVDNFRCQFNKGVTHISLNRMRGFVQKLTNHQILYKQLWEAIVWCWCIEYAQLDVKKEFNPALTTDGYHQGGLDTSYSVGGVELSDYTVGSLTPNDYTLHLGNKTGIRTREMKTFNIKVAANHFWNFYFFLNIEHTISSDNTLTITKVNTSQHSYNISAIPTMVSGKHIYDIRGLTDSQSIIFKTSKGDVTVTEDGEHEIDWGNTYKDRNIVFSKAQTNCNITISITSAPSSEVICNQTSWDVPHWRGFNGFWYGDTFINIENFLSIYDSTKQKRIYYWTDDVTKFDSTTDNKEHSIEDIVTPKADWVNEFNLGNQGNLTARSYNTGKNIYQNNNTKTGINTIVTSCVTKSSSKCNLMYIQPISTIVVYNNVAFVTCTIID